MILTQEELIREKSDEGKPVKQIRLPSNQQQPGTPFSKKCGEKEGQGLLKDGIGVIGVDGRLLLVAYGKHCMSIFMVSHLLHPSVPPKTNHLHSKNI
jgi:hypothetical protein